VLTAPKINTPKDSKRSLNFFPEENIEPKENLNLSSELNGVFPLSQTSVGSLNLDNGHRNEVCLFIEIILYLVAWFIMI